MIQVPKELIGRIKQEGGYYTLPEDATETEKAIFDDFISRFNESRTVHDDCDTIRVETI